MNVLCPRCSDRILEIGKNERFRVVVCPNGHYYTEDLSPPGYYAEGIIEDVPFNLQFLLDEFASIMGLNTPRPGPFVVRSTKR